LLVVVQVEQSPWDLPVAVVVDKSWRLKSYWDQLPLFKF
jgi:hypothetical protein